MYYRKASGLRKKRLIGIRILCFVIVFLLLLFLADRKLRPVICNNASIQAKVIATKALNEAVAKTLEQVQEGYSSYVTLEKGTDGRVTSIQTNTAAIGKAQSALTKSVMECLTKLESDALKMALGTLLQPEFFSGKGPKIRFYLQPNGYVTTKILSSFSEAGINQTRHKILFKVSLPISGAISGYHSVATIETDFILADTVIVGSIPENYTNVVSEDQNLVGKLNDYGTDSVQ